MQAWIVLAGLAAGLIGCGSQSPACLEQPANLSVSPATATRDHAAFAPANQQQFLAVSTPKGAGPGCAVPALAIVLKPLWTVSDPQNVSISSAPDATNGLAKCNGSTAGPVTVTAHITQATGSTLLTASLFCE